MKKASLAHAKAHLSEIVDAAEHRGVSTLIQRHGKPSAVIVPVETVERKKRHGLSKKEIAALHAELEQAGNQDVSAVDDLIEGRR